MHICAKGAGSKEMSEQYCFLWLIMEMYRINFYAIVVSCGLKTFDRR